MSLLIKIKKSFFPFYREKTTKEVFDILNKGEKNNAMFVGGCVRKYLSNEEVDDIDIATSFTPDEIIRKFSESKFEVKKTGIEHGTLTLIRDNRTYEITTLREDVSTDGRHAQVDFTQNWKKDSERRDFTINSIYMNQKGKIFDPQNGMDDLKNQRIKFIGDPNRRIKEDYLRILRYIRFSLQYTDLSIDTETKKAINLNVNGIPKLSKERVFSELIKILYLKNFDNILENNFLLNTMKVIFPEFRYFERLKKIKEYKRKKLGHKKWTNGFIESLLLIDNTDNHEYFSHKYKVSNTKKEIYNFYFKYFNQFKNNKNFFDKDLKKNLFFVKKNSNLKMTMQDLANFFYMTQPKLKFSELKSLSSKIYWTRLPKYPISGEILLKKGVKSGKKVGEAIKEIEKNWLDNNFRINNDELNSIIKKYI